MTVIAVVLAILMAVLFSAFNDLINTMTYGTAYVDGFDEDFNVDIDVVLPGQGQTTNGESSQGTVYSPETVEFMLSSLREALAEAEAEKAEIGYDYYMQQDRIYAIRGHRSPDGRHRYVRKLDNRRNVYQHSPRDVVPIAADLRVDSRRQYLCGRV